MSRKEPCANCGCLIDLKRDGFGHDPVKGLLCVDCWEWNNNPVKHTSTPWVAEPEEASDHRGIAICAPFNGDHFPGAIVATITPADDRTADARDWSDAAFIIQAVNSYEDLVKALEHAVAMMETHIDRYGDPAKLFDLESYRAVLSEARDQAWKNCLQNAPQRILKLLGLAISGDSESEGMKPRA